MSVPRILEQIRSGSLSLAQDDQPLIVSIEERDSSDHSQEYAPPQLPETKTHDKQEGSTIVTSQWVTGHNLPRGATLYGRSAELATIEKWVADDSCRLVGIFGMDGMGR